MPNDSYSKISIPTELSEAQEQQGTASSLYSRLEEHRAVFLDRARDSSKITIPMLIPPAGYG